MLEIRYYVAANGDEPFADWFAEVEAVARAKVVRAIARMEQGNLSNVKSVGAACGNTGSISDPAIGSISGVTVKRW
jgi:hypothetical protein